MRFISNIYENLHRIIKTRNYITKFAVTVISFNLTFKNRVPYETRTLLKQQCVKQIIEMMRNYCMFIKGQQGDVIKYTYRNCIFIHTRNINIFRKSQIQYNTSMQILV